MTARPTNRIGGNKKCSCPARLLRLRTNSGAQLVRFFLVFRQKRYGRSSLALPARLREAREKQSLRLSLGMPLRSVTFASATRRQREPNVKKTEAYVSCTTRQSRHAGVRQPDWRRIRCRQRTRFGRAEQHCRPGPHGAAEKTETPSEDGLEAREPRRPWYTSTSWGGGFRGGGGRAGGGRRR